VSTMSNGSPAQLPSDAEVRNVIEQNGGNVGIAMVALHLHVCHRLEELEKRAVELEQKKRR
jgi:hypothetical protein